MALARRTVPRTVPGSEFRIAGSDDDGRPNKVPCIKGLLQEIDEKTSCDLCETGRQKEFIGNIVSAFV